MIVKRRLILPLKHVFANKHRFYSNRNMLKLYERDMYEEIFPHNSKDQMVNLLMKQPQCVYAGFDPTADSLHIGNLLILMNLLHWQRGGHQVIALMGGATGLIGDPSHRKSERQEIENSLIDQNLQGIQKNIEKIFINHEKYFWDSQKSKLKPPIILNNMEWYEKLNVIEFIRQIGKYFRLGTMLNRTSVQTRLGSEIGMSFTEFSYSLFQAYDWLHLWKTYQCLFQIGGIDQMGNIMSGHDLISRMYNNAQVYGLTLPLITTEGGKKFGKSSGNAVWLSADKSSSFELYQFFIRTTDADVEKFLKLFTFFSIDKIKNIVEAHKKNPDKREAQKMLAKQVTILVHGEEGLEAAQKASNILYNKSADHIATMKVEELTIIFKGASVVDMTADPGLTVYELAMKAKCFKTSHDANRIIEAGGFYINHQRMTNISEVIVAGIHILPNNVTLLRTGKKNYTIVKWM